MAASQKKYVILIKFILQSGKNLNLLWKIILFRSLPVKYNTYIKAEENAFKILEAD